MKRFLSLLLLLLALAISSEGAQLVIWSFPTPLSGIGSGTPIAPTAENVAGSPVLQLFNQEIDANGKTGVEYLDSTGVLRPALNNGAVAWDDFRGDGPDGELWMTLNTAGYADLSLRFDVRENDNPLDNSARQLRVEYSADGGANFIPFATLSIPNNGGFTAQSVNLSSIAAIERAAGVVLRLSQGGTGDGNAINDSTSFDNLEITGTPTNANAPAIAIAGTTTTRLGLGASGGGVVSGVLGDPTDPAAQQGINFTLSDPNGPSGLALAVASSNALVVPAANLALSGSGTSRTLKITPTAVGTATITATVTDPQGNTGTYEIAYAASAASSTPSVSRFHTGASDASAAVSIDTTHMLVANDEDQTLRLFERANSGLPLAKFNFSDSLGLTREADLEAAVRIGNRVYWIGSHGNERDGSAAPTRRMAFSTDLSGSGAGTSVTFVNRFTGLRDNLIAWDNANTHGLGAGALGLAASAAEGVLPTAANGFNIEGATLAPGGGSTILLGFRAPLQNTAERNRALVIPATNLTSVINAGSGTVTFGAPIFLDLGGRAIRAMDTTTSGQVLILAGPVDDPVPGTPAGTFQLFLWNGSAASAPVPLPSSIDALAENAAGSPEAVFDLPASIVNGSSIGVLIDNGSTDHYATGAESKDLAPNWQKFRADPVTLTVPTIVSNNLDAGAGSLREAVADVPAGGAIVFAPALSGQLIPLTTGQLTIEKSLTIDASMLANGLTISGEDNSRIFEVNGAHTVTLAGLTLREGFADDGGAIRNSGGNLTVSGCTLLGNIATQRGGAVYSDTDLATQKTVLVNTTITGNLANGGGGGGVFNFDGRAELRHCTITENSAPNGLGGGVASYGDAFTETVVAAAVIAGNASADVDFVFGPGSNSFTSQGGSVIGGGNALGDFNQPGDVTGAAPALLPLARYGGSTETMPPRPGSLAIDRAAGSTTPADQRGLARPVNVAADSGAVEFAPALVTNASDSGPGSLRAALALPFASTVTFSGSFAITLASELAISRAVSIDASSVADVTLSGGNATRVLSLGGGGLVLLANLSIVSGNSGSDAGAGVLINGAAKLDAANCLFAQNVTNGVGGGLCILDGAATLTNTTFTQNTASDGAAIWAQGGASGLHLRHATVTGNTGIYAIVSFVGMTLENTAVAGNSANNFFESQPGKPVLLGANYTSGDPQLMPFGFYGGGSRCLPPLPASPLVDAALSSTLTIDQRGAPRPGGAARDIGAVEYQPVTVTNSANAGSGTLRAAVTEPFASAIRFSPAISTITLASEIEITRPLFLDATPNAAGVTLSGGGATRLFRVNGGNLRLDALTLTGGSVSGSGSDGNGGAIFNQSGALALNRCTLFGNSATSGGALSILAGTATLTQCTLANNSASSGGAIRTFETAQLSLTQCTLSGNTASQSAPGMDLGGNSTLRNSIVDGDPGPPMQIRNFRALTRVGANLIVSSNDEFPGTSSGPAPITQPALLAPLGDYGGPTKTMALLPGSPARNAAVGSTFTSDQRGFPFISGAPDLGAYEAGVFSNYNAWAYELLPIGSDYAFTADADANGLANGADYAFLTGQVTPAPTALPHFAKNASSTLATLTFPIRFAATDLRYELQRSTTLTGWTTIWEYNTRTGAEIYHDPAVTFVDVNGSYLTLGDPFIAGQDKVFYLLRIHSQ